MEFQMRLIRFFALAAALAVVAAPAIRAAERSEIPEEYKWNLADLYADEAAWVAAKQDLIRPSQSSGGGRASSARRLRIFSPQ
jgi:hypothetical protein